MQYCIKKQLQVLLFLNIIKIQNAKFSENKYART